MAAGDSYKTRSCACWDSFPPKTQVLTGGSVAASRAQPFLPGAMPVGNMEVGNPLFRSMAANNLSLYQAKRDFTKTAEPSGKAHVKPAKYPRFVIQKHAAS